MPPAGLFRLLPLAAFAVPAVVFAQVGAVSRVVGIFNVMVGLMLTVALLTYGIGFIMWVIRLGTWPTYRTDAIRALEWSVATLFTLVVLLAIVQFFQRHPYEATYVLSAIVIILIIWIIVYLIAHSGGEEKKEERR
jgi:VIT1/CCC1 family predicted Fe2+/Mn2+ transporter